MGGTAYAGAAWAKNGSGVESEDPDQKPTRTKTIMFNPRNEYDSSDEAIELKPSKKSNQYDDPKRKAKVVKLKDPEPKKAAGYDEDFEQWFH